MKRRSIAAWRRILCSAQLVLDHRFTRRHLSAYFEEDLELFERQRVERHIAECRDCIFTARSLQRMLVGLALLRRGTRSHVSENLRARLGT